MTLRFTVYILTVMVIGSHYTAAIAQQRRLDASERYPPVKDDQVARYTALRVNRPITIDGKLDESNWKHAPRSPQFVDLISGEKAIHDTRAAVIWDDENLYVGFWVEEPFVRAKFTERDKPIYYDNDVDHLQRTLLDGPGVHTESGTHTFRRFFHTSLFPPTRSNRASNAVMRHKNQAPIACLCAALQLPLDSYSLAGASCLYSWHFRQCLRDLQTAQLQNSSFVLV